MTIVLRHQDEAIEKSTDELEMEIQREVIVDPSRISSRREVIVRND